MKSTYDRSTITPGIVHFGVGNFHRAHQAVYLDQLMRQGKALDWGICGVGVMPGDSAMRDALLGQDCLYTVTLKYPDGTSETSTIGSIVDYVFAPEDPQTVLEIMASPKTRIVSLTVTEGGYNIDDATKEYRRTNENALYDASHPTEPLTAFGFIVEALRLRREQNIPPFTVMSCDNLPGNGSIARTAIVSQADMSNPELAQWISDNVAFPNGMVDRITPVTTPEDIALVRETTGIDDAWPVTCEPFIQWVIEDDFPMGRPPLEEVGVQLVDDVVPYELMKLRLLNASHQSLAHWGRLLGYTFAHEAASDPDIEHFTREFLTREALTTLPEVPGIDVTNYIDILFERFTNSAIADTLARLAFDASDRMPKFVIPTAIDRAHAGDSSPLAAGMCAAWALGMEGSMVQLDIQDSHWPTLKKLVSHDGGGSAEGLLSDVAVLGPLTENNHFRQDYCAALGLIRTQGARAAIKALSAFA